MYRLLSNWWFWMGVILITEAIILFFMMGWYKFHRVRRRKSRDIDILIRQCHDAKLIGHHPCRFDEAVWHAGLCTKIACPSTNNRSKTGALYYAHR